MLPPTLPKEGMLKIEPEYAFKYAPTGHTAMYSPGTASDIVLTNTMPTLSQICALTSVPILSSATTPRGGVCSNAQFLSFSLAKASTEHALICALWELTPIHIANSAWNNVLVSCMILMPMSPTGPVSTNALSHSMPTLSHGSAVVTAWTHTTKT